MEHHSERIKVRPSVDRFLNVARKLFGRGIRGLANEEAEFRHPRRRSEVLGYAEINDSRRLATVTISGHHYVIRANIPMDEASGVDCTEAVQHFSGQGNG